jgi:outer membrane protein assembly factor BamB
MRFLRISLQRLAAPVRAAALCSAAGAVAVSLSSTPVQGAEAPKLAVPAKPAGGAESSGAVATPDSWPMFRGNPGLTGISPAKLPDSLSLLWTYKTGGPVKSSAAIVDGRVFIGSDDKQLHCIDLKTGQKVWSLTTEGEIESSPLVLDKLVYVGSADGGLYAVEAATGKTNWTFRTEDKILGAPNWFTAPDGKSKWILAGSYDYRLYCFDAATGKTNWTYETGNYINGTPAVAGGNTVFGGCDALLHVISLKDGQKVKEVDAGAYIAGSGAFEGSRFYVGHYENEFLCADLEKGAIEWKFKDRAFPYFSSPALTADRVVFGGRDKRLHCVRKDNGEEIWAFQARGKVDSSPVIVGDKVVVGSEDGNLYMVKLADGTEVWSYEIGEAVTSSPAVVNGIVVVGSEDGNVYAFGTKK